MVGRQLATQILWSFVMKAFVSHQEDLKSDPLFSGQPRQLGKHRGDVVEFAASQGDSGAEFGTRCYLSSSTFGKPYRRLLQLSSPDSTCACTQIFSMQSMVYHG